MASNKDKQVQTNTLGFGTPPATQASTNLQNMVDKGVDFTGPIRNAYGRAEQKLDRSYQNPLGAYTTADVRDKSLREQTTSLNQEMGLDLSNATQAGEHENFNRQALVAGLTAPVPFQSGSTNSSKWTTADTLGLVSSVGGGVLS